MVTKTDTLNLEQVSILLNSNNLAVKKLVALGMPCVSAGGKGRSWAFDKAKVLEWYGEHKANHEKPTTLAETKLRHEMAKTELAEINLAVRKGELVSTDDVLETIKHEYVRVREGLLALPSRIAPTLLLINQIEEMEASLTEAVNEILSELQYDRQKSKKKT